jgi:hypothetical protein
MRTLTSYFLKVGLPRRHGKRRPLLSLLLLLSFGLLFEVVDVLEDILLNHLQVLDQLRLFLVLVLVGVHELPDHEKGDLIVELGVLLLELLFGDPDLLDGFLHLFMKLIALLAKLLALFLFQVPQVLLGHGLPFLVGRDDHHAHLRELKDEALIFRHLGKAVDDFTPRLFESLVDLGFLCPIIVAVEDLGDLGEEGLDELLHILLEHLTHAGRNFETLGLVRFLEVVDIAPVRRRRFFLGLFFDERLGGIGQACFGRTCNEDIVSALLHPHAEVDGIDGTLLADHLLLRHVQ